MAPSRLPFLYPNLLRAVRSCEPTTHRSIRFPPQGSKGSPHNNFHSSSRCQQETYHQRYGPAAEPRLPPPPRPKDAGNSQAAAGSKDAPQKADGPSENAPPQETNKQESSDAEGAEQNSVEATASANLAAELPQQDTPKQDAAKQDAAKQDTVKQDAAKQPNASNIENPSTTSSSDRYAESPDPAEREEAQNPLEKVWRMPPPNPNMEMTTTSSNSGMEGQKHPHLAARPYVHHFDTYTLVRDLEKGGFSEDQSVTLMKAVRGRLAENLGVAQASLVSKSDVENEVYLFNAACSELRTSIETSRNMEIQRQRTQRAQLQHEVDILEQKMTQEFKGLRDDLKGMFNDQKMSSRELQRSLDTMIQELNYQITVSLTSDGKSEAEGLRWLLTRRAAMAIGVSAVMIILALNYSSYKNHGKAEQKHKEVAKKAAPADVETIEGAQELRRRNAPPPEALVSETLG